jgi:hypothetical protein
VSQAKAERLLLSRLAAGTTAFLPLLLDAVLACRDGVDAMGRSILLVGRHALGRGEAAEAATAAVLEALADGEVPEGVHALAYAPKASEAIAEIVAGQSAEVLLDGPGGAAKPPPCQPRWRSWRNSTHGPASRCRCARYGCMTR